MPNAKMDALNSNSTDPQIQEAISSEIEMCMGAQDEAGGSPTDKRKRCAGKAYGMARERTGKQLGG